MTTAQDALSLQERSPLSFSTRAESRSRTQAGQLYLKFQIPASAGPSSMSFVMPMGCIQEVLSLPVQRLSPMPNMPSCMLGLMNRGNRIFWLMDLGLLLGISRLEPNTQQHSVMILRSGAAAIGVAVSRVDNMQWLNDAQLHPKPLQVQPKLSPYITGEVELQAVVDPLAASSSPRLEPEGFPAERLLVLDAGAIFQAPVLQSLAVA